METTKKFNGKTYHYTETISNKAKALEKAKVFRRFYHRQARVIKTFRGYEIWTKKKSPYG